MLNRLCKKQVILTAILLIMSSCGGQKQRDNVRSYGEKELTGGFMEIPIKLSATGKSLALAGASSFSMSLSECASGYSIANVTQDTPSISIYQNDQGCLLKLHSFSFGGAQFVPSAADPFSSYLVQDSALFEDTANPSNVLQVVVASQISSPSDPNDTVSYFFASVEDGGLESISDAITSSSHSIEVFAAAAPQFQISGVSFVGIAPNGAGEFTFVMECQSALIGTSIAAECNEIFLNEVKYILIKDTYGGTLSLSEAAALFSGASSGIDASEVLALGSTDAPNGGFVTKTLVGPEVMHQNREMLLVVEGAGASYQVFNVDVETLTYP